VLYFHEKSHDMNSMKNHHNFYVLCSCDKICNYCNCK
jgi:hypothetical protein